MKWILVSVTGIRLSLYKFSDFREAIESAHKLTKHTGIGYTVIPAED